MKNLNCHGGHNVTTLPGRVIWFAGGGEAPKLPDKESQKEFSEITKAVKDLENEKSNVQEEHDKVVEKLVQMMKDKPAYFSPELLRALAKRTEGGVRSGVARNPNTPVDVLRVLAKDGDVFVRGGVANNPHTPADELHELAKDKYRLIVLVGVANNPNTPVDVLRELVKDKYDIIRLGIAGNPHTPADELHELAKDKDEYIRGGIAGNPSTPVDVLRELAKDGNKDVAKRAKARLEKI